MKRFISLSRVQARSRGVQTDLIRSLDNPGRGTDTTDTVFLETAANWRNYRNFSLRADVLVTCINTGYYLHL